MIEVMLPQAWRTDRAERDLPDGTVVCRRGRGVIVKLTPEDAQEMLSDLKHYARSGMDQCDPGVVRAAKVALPRLQIALTQ